MGWRVGFRVWGVEFIEVLVSKVRWRGLFFFGRGFRRRRNLSVIFVCKLYSYVLEGRFWKDIDFTRLFGFFLGGFFDGGNYGGYRL